MPGVAEIAGERANKLTVLTHDRRSARYAEVVGWYQAVVDNAWVGHGYGSPSGWISAATGEPFGAVKRMLHLGQRLTVMPETALMFELGLISEQGAMLLADAWAEPIADQFARDEVMLVDWVKCLPYADAKTVIAAWIAHADPNRVERSNADAFDRRSLHVSQILDGVGVLNGTLDAEGCATVTAALGVLNRRADGDTRSKAQRNADALVSMAKFTLAHHESPVGTKRRRPAVNVTVPYETLLERTGRSLLESHEITPETVRRLTCDADLHRVITHAKSAVIEYGQATRTVPDNLWRLLVMRDGSCRFPGCPITAEGCDAHHAEHYADGGPTELANLTLLCWFHHHWMHEMRWRLEPLGAGHFVLRSPAGQLYDFSHPRLEQLAMF
jgi:hypothetical protein